MTKVESEIELLYNEKAIGAQFRSLDYIEVGEINSKYFLNLEKSRQSRKSLNIMYSNGTMVTNTTDILQEEVRFYRTLYTSQTNNIKAIHTYVTDTTVDYKLTNNEQLRRLIHY